MNYKTATNDDLEIKLGELLGMGRFAALTAPRYCTNWNATMPLAIEHSIELSPCYSGRYYAGIVETYKHEEVSSDYFAQTFDIDPLRAVVICLIKKLERPR